MNIAISSWDFVLITRMKLRVKGQRSSLPVESPYPKQWTGELRDTLPQSRIKVCCKSQFKRSLLNQLSPSQWRSQGNFFGGRGEGVDAKFLIHAGLALALALALARLKNLNK